MIFDIAGLVLGRETGKDRLFVRRNPLAGVEQEFAARSAALTDLLRIRAPAFGEALMQVTTKHRRKTDGSVVDFDDAQSGKHAAHETAL